MRSFTPAEIAAQAKCSVKLVYKQVKLGIFPAHFIRLGKLIRIDADSWERYCRTGIAEQGEITPNRKGPKRKELYPLDLAQFQTPAEIRA